jgi:hypothetical protein
MLAHVLMTISGICCLVYPLSLAMYSFQYFGELGVDIKTSITSILLGILTLPMWFFIDAVIAFTRAFNHSPLTKCFTIYLFVKMNLAGFIAIGATAYMVAYNVFVPYADFLDGSLPYFTINYFMLIGGLVAPFFVMVFSFFYVKEDSSQVKYQPISLQQQPLQLITQNQQIPYYYLKQQY